jgi:hypothetical protein
MGWNFTPFHELCINLKMWSSKHNSGVMHNLLNNREGNLRLLQQLGPFALVVGWVVVCSCNRNYCQGQNPRWFRGSPNYLDCAGRAISTRRQPNRFRVVTSFRRHFFLSHMISKDEETQKKDMIATYFANYNYNSSIMQGTSWFNVWMEGCRCRS